MPVEYSLGYRKPPVSGQFRKGQSGNPGGQPKARPRPTRTQRFAQMLEAGLMEPVEKVATMPCRSALAAGAKGMVLDMVRGKTATIRMIFTFMNELDVMEGNLERTRRARPARMPVEVDDGDEADFPGTPVSQGIIEEDPLPVWADYAAEAPGGGSNTESPSAAAQEGASPLAAGSGQGLKPESERQLLAISRRVPSEKELRQREKQAEMDRKRRAYESLPGIIKGFCDQHGMEYPPGMQASKDVPPPLTGGQTQGTTNPRPEEGPHKRALRERFLRLAEAEREEAARKAALAAKRVPLTPALSPKDGGEGDEPEPLPDFSIWMRGQKAAS